MGEVSDENKWEHLFQRMDEHGQMLARLDERVTGAVESRRDIESRMRRLEWLSAALHGAWAGVAAWMGFRS